MRAYIHMVTATGEGRERRNSMQSTLYAVRTCERRDGLPATDGMTPKRESGTMRVRTWTGREEHKVSY